MTYNITLTQTDINKLGVVLSLAKSSLDELTASIQTQLAAQAQAAAASQPPNSDAPPAE